MPPGRSRWTLRRRARRRNVGRRVMRRLFMDANPSTGDQVHLPTEGPAGEDDHRDHVNESNDSQGGASPRRTEGSPSSIELYGRHRERSSDVSESEDSENYSYNGSVSQSDTASHSTSNDDDDESRDPFEEVSDSAESLFSNADNAGVEYLDRSDAQEPSEEDLPESPYTSEADNPYHGDPEDPDEPMYSSDSEDRDDSDPEEVAPFFHLHNRLLNKRMKFSSPATIKNAIALTIAQALRHNWSYVGIEDNLEAWNALLGNEDIKTSKYFLWKYVGRDRSALTFHVYCCHYGVYISIRSSDVNEYHCRVCGTVQDRCHAVTFVSISLARQLSRLLQLPKVKEFLKYRDNRNVPQEEGMEDILDGAAYKTLRRDGEILHSNLNYSYSFNSDGFRLSNSSSLEAWPVYILINELPPTVRHHYMILGGVWVSKKHPNMNTFLMPIVQEANTLSTVGVKWRPNNTDEVCSRFYPTVLTVDSVARYSMLSMTSFAGEYACPTCLINGLSEDEHGNAFTHRKYPIQQQPSALRNMHQTIEAMSMAARTGLKVLGFKGISVLIYRLLHFKFPLNIVGDCLHVILLGVVKKHIKFFTKGSNANEPFYLGPALKDQLNDRLLAIRTPSVIQRPPRSIHEMLSWTGAEWRSFILYYCVPCLKGIIPNVYVQHLSYLSHALFLLSSQIVSPHDIERAERLIHMYRVGCQNMFGIKYMVFNLHLLGHVPYYVHNWGPLRAHDTMCFERLNGDMKRRVKGPTDGADQIATRYLLMSFLREVAEEEDVGGVAKYIKSTVFHEADIGYSHVIGRGCFKGQGEVQPPTAQEQFALHQQGYQCQLVHRHKSVHIRGYKYSTSHAHHLKIDNSCLFYQGNEIGIFQNAVWFQNNGMDVAGVFVRVVNQERHPFAAAHIVEGAVTNELAFVAVDDVLSPAVQMTVADTHYYSPLPNQVEQH